MLHVGASDGNKIALFRRYVSANLGDQVCYALPPELEQARAREPGAKNLGVRGKSSLDTIIYLSMSESPTKPHSGGWMRVEILVVPVKVVAQNMIVRAYLRY